MLHPFSKKVRIEYVLKDIRMYFTVAAVVVLAANGGGACFN